MFGGLYYLKRTAEALIVSDKGDSQLICHGIMSGGRRLETCHLVMAVSTAPPQFLKAAPSGGMSRGIFITDR